MSARFAILALILFPLCGVTAYAITALAVKDDHTRDRLAAAWGRELMEGSELTPYGWIPDADTSRRVDESLATADAAYVLLDAEQRVVRASDRLTINRAALLNFGFDRLLTTPPLAGMEVTRTPLQVFGLEQGVFYLLSQPGGSAVPWPPSGADQGRDGPSSILLRWQYLLGGALLAALGFWLGTYFLVVRRLQGLTAGATKSSGGRRPPRRFAPGGSDEISRLATNLNTMRRRAHGLQSSMASRENRRRDWLSELSHDLRTPLAALRLRLENAAQAEGEEQLRELATTAVGDCERIQRLASGFMDLAELEVTEDFSFEPVMPEELVGQAVRGLRPIAEAAEVDLSTQISPQATILADGHRLLRALENMLRNAIRHARTEVIAGVRSTREEIRFFVRDDGEGFPGLALDELVDYPNWLGRHQAGGLGLRVADRIATAHGGRLVLSNRSSGTLVICTVARTSIDDESGTLPQPESGDGDLQ